VVGSGTRVAARRVRVCARLVDLVLAFGVAGGLAALAEAVAGYHPVVVASGWLIPVAYEIGFSATGGTPGKRLFRLRIAHASGVLTPGAAVTRAVALLPLMAVWPMNLLVMVVDRRTARAIHDAIAGTVVVRADVRDAYGVRRAAPPPGSGAPPLPGLAAPGRRVAARGVDLLACAAIAFTAVSLLNALVVAPAAATPAWAPPVVVAVYLLTGPAYEIACAFAGGTTPGKRLLGLRVVRLTGGAAPFGTLAARAALLWALALVPGLIGAVCDLMAMLYDDARRGALHDLRRTTVVDAPL
jgi:uncharacterized RDD family membrane protein YckC